jgi:LmbE family N-acetylglucosaminyl deacetylase
MKLHNPNAEIFVPDSTTLTKALSRTTHLGIGAHQDDLEFMAFHGILECFSNENLWFTGVTCTDGAGSSRTGPYASFSNEQMMAIRRKEQNNAAVIGQYAAMLQLDYPSSTIKNPSNTSLKEDLFTILNTTQPQIIYTHNPADKHDTHIAVTIATILAIREMPADTRPKKLIGCEVWRNLDWLPDNEKILMNVSGRDNLAASLNGVFDSQITGGKRYDLAIQGRRYANSTFFDSHSSDQSTQVIFGIDLTPLITDTSLDIPTFVCSAIQRFHNDVREKLTRQLS